MKSLRKGILLLGVLATILLNTGCISYSGKELPKVKSFPRSEVKPSVDVSYSFHNFANGQEVGASVPFREKFYNKIMERFGASGLFCSVRSGDASADILVTVAVTNYGTGSMFLAEISGASLGLIPCRSEDEWRVAASVLDRKTKSTSTVEVVDSQVLWMHILLLPVMPFYVNDETLENDILNNLMDTLALRVYETTLGKGSAVLNSKPSAPARAESDSNP